MKEEYKVIISRFLWIAIALFILRCTLSFAQIKQSCSIYSLWGFASEAIAVTVLIIVFYEKWIWKIDPFVKRPVLCKKYSGTIVSSFDDKIRTCELKIKQSLWSVDVIMKSEESESSSITTLIENRNGYYYLTYTYINNPNASMKDVSPIHYGTAVLRIEKDGRLSGQYYTDRKTRGDINLSPNKSN